MKSPQSVDGESLPPVPSTPRMFPRRLDGIVGPILAVAIAAWITLPAWGVRPFAGVDVIAHVMRVTFGVEQLILRGRLDGWDPAEHLGYQLYLIRGPGMSWLTALIKAMSLNRLPTVAALNVAVLSSFVAFPLAVAFLARSSGLGRTASGLAALLSLLVSNPFGNGIEGLFGLGLLENQVGALYFPAVLGALIRVANGGSMGWALFGASGLALLLLTHTLSALVLPPIAALYVPWFLGRRHEPALLRLCLTGALAAGLAGFWLIPLLAHRDLVGTVVPGYGRSLLDIYIRHIIGGMLLFRPRVVWIVLAGWAFVLVRTARGHWRDLAAIAAPAAYLALGHALYHSFPSRAWIRWSDSYLSVGDAPGRDGEAAPPPGQGPGAGRCWRTGNSIGRSAAATRSTAP